MDEFNPWGQHQHLPQYYGLDSFSPKRLTHLIEDGNAFIFLYIIIIV